MMFYSPEELASETRSLSEMALEQLERGNLDQVRFLLGRMSVGHIELYFGYLDWVTRMAGKILRDFGEDYFETTSGRIARFLMAPYAEGLGEGERKGGDRRHHNPLVSSAGPDRSSRRDEQRSRLLAYPVRFREDWCWEACTRPRPGNIHACETESPCSAVSVSIFRLR